MTAQPSCILEIKAVPNAARSEIVGWLGEVLKIKLHAPPVAGKANTELCAFLAKQLGLPKGSITIATGNTSRLKRVRIEGMTLDEVHTRIDG